MNEKYIGTDPSAKDIWIDIEGLTEDKTVSIEIQNLDLPDWTVEIIDNLIELINRQLSPVRLDIEFT